MHLQRFNQDVNTRESVRAYFIAYFEAQIVKTAREGKEVASLAQALNNVDDAFNQLAIDFNVKPEPTEGTSAY